MMDDNQDDRVSENNEDHTDTNSIQRNPDSLPELIFRNYQPQTPFLEGLYTTRKAQPGSIAAYIKDKLDLLEDDRNNVAASDNPYKIDLKNLELKKPDWDLKLRISKKMDKLDRETRRVIDEQIKLRKTKGK